VQLHQRTEGEYVANVFKFHVVTTFVSVRYQDDAIANGDG
jgi:hypothetical protein